MPGLIRDCIIGMALLKEGGCTIDIPNNYIKFSHHKNQLKPPVIKMLNVFVQEEESEIGELIQQKVDEITELSESSKQELQNILRENQEVFWKRPGRITGYQHRLNVIDTRPYCLNGWPIPMKYQRPVDEEIQRMEDYRIIERAASPYINPMVTVIKKETRVCGFAWMIER